MIGLAPRAVGVADLCSVKLGEVLPVSGMGVAAVLVTGETDFRSGVSGFFSSFGLLCGVPPDLELGRLSSFLLETTLFSYGLKTNLFSVGVFL